MEAAQTLCRISLGSVAPVLTESRPLRAFAFDLDETLVDCSRQHDAATRQLCVDAGVEPARVRHVFEQITGQRTRDILEAFRVASGVKHGLDDLLESRARAFREALRVEPPALLPGVQAVLDEARKLGPLALVTSGHVADVEASLEAVGIHAHFDVVVTGEDVAWPKPHPEPYLLAAERLRVAPAELLAFEDSEKGVRAALQAGCRVVAVPNVATTRRDQVADAHAVVSSLEDVLPLSSLVKRLSRLL